MKMRGAQAIVNSLIDEDVDTIFGYPGGAIMPTYDALFDHQEKLRHVLVRHEQAAIHGAVGYARATAKTGVVIATSGPGATNLITGITDALIDSIPVVCITGQIFSDLLGSDAFQEADIIGMTVTSTKWNYQITNPDEIPYIFKKAFEIARSGRPGPVLIDITKDAQVNLTEYKKAQANQQAKWLKKPLMNMNSIHKASELLNQAERPIILAGHGVIIAKAEKELLQLAEKGDIPIACTLLGLSSVASTHRLYKGMLGMHGNYAANVLSNQADVVLAVGMRFDDRVTGKLSDYLPNAKVIHIEIDSAEIDKNIKADIGIHADAKDALSALIPYLKCNVHQNWHDEFKHYYQKELACVIKHETNPNNGPIKMAEVIDLVSRKTHGNALIVSDVGQHQMIAARYYQFADFNLHITSGGLGTMGFALPAAIGAKVGLGNQRDVIAIAGDGGFQMNIQELAVLNQEGIHLKMIILNNSYLGMVRQWQELFFEKRYSFTEISSPDFIKVAQAYGIEGKLVKSRDNLSQSLDEFLNYQGSYLLEVVVEQQENVFPMVPAGASISDTQLSVGG
ncbi:biosynthetic-type acetolactate synthase large subunit [Thiotrichales bacterium 19S3-7]|nr:biosynthetic-type acetolactate synthase large subunit [Thiotrichales bacterium 19S3-7]MCF6801343.1 biosynthetic-type acetolactate synthase large subunit [Thiotrichales bacterium 19S3-11]